MIVACLALAASLGGTGIAAVNAVLPKNSVGTAQLKNNSVGTVQLKNSAVTSAKVQNRSITRSDLALGVLTPGPQGAQGPPGPSGSQGVKGDKGDKGDSGAIGDLTVHIATVTVPASLPAADDVYENRSGQANCDANEKGVSGGTNWTGESETTQLTTVLSVPVYDAGAKKITGWRARGGNDTATAHDFQVYVVCAKV
jgi:hypothetical protein